MSVISTFYSEQKENYLYAPGTATYGIEGKTGGDGENGTSIYYSNIPFTNSNFSIIISKIFNNEALIYNSSEKITRDYMVGDIFVAPNGYFWKLKKDKSELIDTDSYNSNIDRVFRNVGKINIEGINNLVGTGSEPFGIYDNNGYIKIYNKGVSGVDFIDEYLRANYQDGSTILHDDNYIVNIIGSQKTDYITHLLNIATIDNLAIAGNTSSDIFKAQNLSVDYDYIDGAFHIKSESPIFLDIEDLRIKPKPSEEIDSYDQYSPVNIYDHPLTELYKFIRNNAYWNYNKDSTTAVDGSLYIHFDSNPKNYGLWKNNDPLVKIVTNNNSEFTEKIISNNEYTGPDSKLYIAIPSVFDSSIYTVSIISNIEVFIQRKDFQS